MINPEQVETVAFQPSVCCIGEHCFCGAPAAKKVGEEILADDPQPYRHNLTRYVCAQHYAQIMGPMGAKQVGLDPAAIEAIRPLPCSELVERLSETLFVLSARLKESGFLNDDANHAAYEAVVSAFQELEASGVLTLEAERERRDADLKAFANYHGDIPDYDHWLRPAFESGIQYTVELLAKELRLEDYGICDGTEEFDGDLGGTLLNIVIQTWPKDENGDWIDQRPPRQALSDTKESAK